MRRRYWVLLGVAVVLIAGATFAVVQPWSAHRAGAGPGSHAVHPPLTAARAQEITSDLSAGTPARLQDAVVLPPGQAIDPNAAPGLAALRLTIDPRSFTPTADAPDEATVRMTPGSGSASGDHTWRARLVFVNGVWKIISTEPAS